jgi:hypothetical protein
MVRSRALTPLFVLLVLLGGLVPLSAAAHPVSASGAARQDDQRCFVETGFCIGGRIRTFWEQNGGLPVFGFPTGPQQAERVEGRLLQVQQFERHRMELHPEHPFPYDVLLGRLGAEQLAQLRIASLPDERQAGCSFFEQMQHLVCGEFARAWQANGLEFDGQPGSSFEESLALFGLPVSGVMTLTLSDGRPYQVQYFERARFERHPENSPPFDVLFGLLNSETRTASLPPRPPTLLPAPLFFRDGSVIFRLERDGLTQVPLLDERARGAITTFSVAPDGRSFAYVLKAADGERLIGADPAGAGRELYASDQPIMSLSWAPDSARLAFYTGSFEGREPGGIFSVPAAGGPAELLQADDVASTPPISYLPGPWSPDGRSLLVARAGRQTEGCFARRFDLATRRLHELPAPDLRPLRCGGTWAPDGTLLISVTPVGSFANAGLWQVDTARGTVAQLVPEQGDFGFNLLGPSQPVAGGSVHTFIARAAEPPRLGAPQALRYAPYSVRPNGTQLRQSFKPAFAFEELAGWAPDGSGFLLRGAFGDPIGRVTTIWVPLDGGAPYAINSLGDELRWGR